MINPILIQDYLEVMRDRKTFDFEDGIVFDKFLQLLAVGLNNQQEFFRQLMQERSIDTAVGKQLDIIGDIVGQPRVLLDIDSLPFFGFFGNPLSQSFGDSGRPEIGGYWWDARQPRTKNQELNDDQYRVFIKAKILKNRTRGTPEDIIEFIKYVFNAKRVSIVIDDDAVARINVDKSISDWNKGLLAFFVETTFKSYFSPKVLGVGFEYQTSLPEIEFGYLGSSNSKGYGTLDTTTGVVSGGGTYVSL